MWGVGSGKQKARGRLVSALKVSIDVGRNGEENKERDGREGWERIWRSVIVATGGGGGGGQRRKFSKGELKWRANRMGVCVV